MPHRPKNGPSTRRAALLALLASAAAMPAAAQIADQNTPPGAPRQIGGTTPASAPASPAAASPAAASPAPANPGTHGITLSKNQPVTFLADRVQYDRAHGIVTATGHVEAWQGDQILRADKLTYDRNSNVMAASGHVQIIEPDGQILFASYAELTSDMKQGVLKSLRGLLAANGRLAGNGARRSPGPINTLSRGVYSTCNICVRNPKIPPLWDLRARTIVEDVPHKRIEYYNAWLDVEGVPVLYLPYFSNADPSVDRQSGFLVPSVGNQSNVGTFFTVPYYLVLNKSSDITIVPTVGTAGVGEIQTLYRQAFNNGKLYADDAVGYDRNALQGYIFSNGRFSYNNFWRYGYDLNVASSISYLSDFNIGNLYGNTLNSDLYAEGFGEGAYAKISAMSYQGVNSTVVNSLLPYVLPRFQYSFVSQPDILGGRISVDTNDFNILREIGTNDQRLNLNAQWQRTGIGRLGDVWTATVRLDTETYNAFDFNQQPNYAQYGTSQTFRAQPTIAFKVSWPFLKTFGNSSLVIEPIAQFIAAPNTGTHMYLRVPNEDSLAPEFTDETLFSLNRFQGTDRQEGGLRANFGLHATWTGPGGMLDGLIGQSYHLHDSAVMPTYVGLGEHVSDYVGRLTYVPSSFFDITARARVDKNNFDTHFAEALADIGPAWLRLSAGYVYSNVTPFWLYYQPPQGNFYQPRNEVTLGLTAKLGRWRLHGYAARDMQLSKMVDSGGTIAYENECAIFAFNFYRRDTTINQDHGYTAATIQITLKTVGTFGFHAF